MARFFYDCEFIEDGSTIDLISIGIVSEDNREYYAQSSEFNVNKANTWVWDNVFPHLRVCPYVQKPITVLQVDVRDHHSMGKCTPEFHLGPLGDYITEGIQAGRWGDCPWRTRKQIKNELLAFMDPAKYGTPELWAYYADYDHVALCQIFGTMMDLPEGYPMYTLDLKQFCFHVGSPELPKQSSTEHNALEDARYNKVMYEFLAKYAQELNDEVSRILGKEHKI